MVVHQSDAIILKTYPLGEADRIVAFFSREHGKVRGVANGARRMKNRFGASLEPLAHSRIIFSQKENRDLVRIQSADLLDSSMKLFEDYDRAVFAAHVIDMVDRFLPEHEPQDAVYRLVRMIVGALHQGCPIDFAAGYFEVWMLRLAGVFPDLFTCSVCGASLGLETERFLASGLQKAICISCNRGQNVGVQRDVPPVLYWILKNKLDTPPSDFDHGLKSLHELNQYWIRHYCER
jgi:DNA repair protein RecO (recombination protein O)